MNWFSHRIFAVGLAALCKFDIIGIAACYLGSTIPDSIDFFLVKSGANFNRIHRKYSHMWLIYAILLAIILYCIFPSVNRYFDIQSINLKDFQTYCHAFFLGIFSHIFLDMLTIKGVPAFINPNKKIAVKLVTTNKYSEQIFIFLFFMATAMYLYCNENPYICYFIEIIEKYL